MAQSGGQAAGHAVPFGPASGQSFQALRDQHLELCRELQEQEAHTLALQRGLEQNELRCAALRAAQDLWAEQTAMTEVSQPAPPEPLVDLVGAGDGAAAAARSFVGFAAAGFACLGAQRVYAADAREAKELVHHRDRREDDEEEEEEKEGDEREEEQDEAEEAAAHEATEALEAEIRLLHEEIEACELSLSTATDTRSEPLPPWAQRCVWRDELDVRAGQLERISLQFDAMKRSLDAANEELQWQATSAEALRMRLTDVLRAIRAEEAKTKQLRAEHRQSRLVVEELLQQWTQTCREGSGRSLPMICQQAEWLLESTRQSEEAEVQLGTGAAQDETMAQGTEVDALGVSGSGDATAVFDPPSRRGQNRDSSLRNAVDHRTGALLQGPLSGTVGLQPPRYPDSDSCVLQSTLVPQRGPSLGDQMLG